MATPGAVTFLLVLAAVVPALLVAGCASCPDGYQACGCRCYKRIDQEVNFSAAKGLCETESIRLSGGNDYIAIPSPRDAAENDCVKQSASGVSVWLGYIVVPKPSKEWKTVSFVDYKDQYTMNYNYWASGQPDMYLSQNETQVVLVPGGWFQFAGWHDYKASSLFHPLCATRFCR